jgi:histidinol-phosphate aminotransferase
MLNYVSSKIKNLIPYAPGKPLEELERELGIEGAIKLASNENPLGPSPKALSAMEKALKNLHRYPDGGGFYLRRALAGKWGVPPEEILIGNGSNEIIELLVRTFVSPGDEAVVSENTFSVYRLITTAAGGEVVTVPMREDRYDLEGMLSKITSRTRLVFLCNPNNPTGTMIPDKEVRGFMEAVPDHLLVVFDEAYGEYVTSKDYPETLPYLQAGRNVAILRTFSKIYGLAGLRVGYGLLRTELSDMVNRVRQPFNTNSLAQIAALAALEDEEHVERSRRSNNEGKAFLVRELDHLGFRHVPTEANFIYFQSGNGMDGKKLFDALLRKGVIIRHIGGPNLRVTIGTAGENKRFIETLKKVMDEA